MTSRSERVPDRRWSLTLVVAGGLGFVAIALGTVPWEWLPGLRVDPVPVESVFSPKEISRGETYSSAQRHLAWASLAVTVTVTLLIGFSPAGARWMGRLPARWWLRVGLGCLAFQTVLLLVSLPFAVSRRGNAVAAGLDTRTLPAWVGDLARGVALDWVTTTLALLVLIDIARRSPRWWPLWSAPAAVALVFAGSFLYPVLVEPVFNDFEPLPKGALRSEVVRLADQEQVRVTDVLVADASRRTTTLNAYVSGFGPTRRVVLYDTLVEQAPQGEVAVVVAHELAHARHDDVVVGTALGAAGAIFGVGLLALLSRRVLVGQTGVGQIGDPRVLPWVLTLMMVGGLVASPVQNAISRAVEARADADALRATGRSEVFEQMQHRLAVRSRSDPVPPLWSQVWFGSHPTTLQRVAMALEFGAADGE